MKAKRTIAFIFFIIAGVIFGSMAAGLTADIPYLGWLSFGKSVGIPVESPFILDLAILKLSLAFEMGVNVAQVICITIGLFIYRKVASKL